MIRKKLNDLTEFVNFCPKCLICGKNLHLKLCYYSSRIDDMHGHNLQNFFKLYYIDGELFDGYNSIINCKKNTMSFDFIKLNFRAPKYGFIQPVTLINACRTCIFEHECQFFVNFNDCNIEDIKFAGSRIRYSFGKNKQKIDIINLYYDKTTQTSICVNNNFIDSIEVNDVFDLSKIKNFSSLKRKIASILTFN